MWFLDFFQLPSNQCEAYIQHLCKHQYYRGLYLSLIHIFLEMQNRDTQLSLMQEQNQKLQKLNSELSELLNICLLYTSRCG